MSMKQRILGTALGRMAASARDMANVMGAACWRPETAGTLLNDRLASILVTRLCKSRKCFIDVGAHIGSIISEVARHDPSVTIIAIEAIPEKVANLRKKFPLVELHACALGESEGEVAFYVNTRRSGYSSLRRPSSSEESETREIKVPLKRLDSLVASDRIDVMKVDVEGAELGVFRGGERLIAENRPTVMFESGPTTDDGLGYPKEALWRWFAERDYAVLIPNRVAHNDPGLSQDGFLESHLYPRRTTNYFAIANERLVEIRDRARDVLNIRVT
jgi:FkbM family methyltransferase